MNDSIKELTIIGIGSSAGGLEAIRELVATLPTDLDVTYVVVQHMSPHHKSLMTELVARQTDLEVADVVDGTKPEANVIYITPPKNDVILDQGVLRLVEPSNLPSAPKPSVDRFLLSLADEHGDKSMAMILSGTGTDGAYGIQAIREAGGITIAQDVESAKYDGMPQAAVQTGCIDLVLRPLEIGTHLRKILSSPRDFIDFRKEAFNENPVSDLLQILLARTRVDFRDYKQTTVTRRIERRMVALGIEKQGDYTLFLRNNPQAVDALFKDLLISVTRFFRDKEEFAKLEALIPRLLQLKPDGPLRVWIAGCATGEEAYSIAMLIAEAMGGPDVPLKEKVQIFATDIDKDALQVARAGVYGNAVLNDIPNDLAEKYLVQHGDGVRVTDVLRTAVLFSDHNVCQDPPFQKVDLLCCRNLLIYFGHSLQKKVMSRFHYAMGPNALLFLGTAETVAGSDELFIADEPGTHVYRKRAINQQLGNYNMPNIPAVSNRAEAPNRKGREAESTERQLFDALMMSLGANSLLVAEDCSILRVNGSISDFVEVTEQSKLKMHLDLLRSPFREEARSLVTIALKNRTYRQGIRHKLDDQDETSLQIGVYPIVAPRVSERVALVVFDVTETPVKKTITKGSDSIYDPHSAERINDLENEVAVTREALQQTIEELETSNEELQALNEELQSTNEELQATNEELETSNEELQSTNEELITVNEELQITTTELSGRTGELTSVLQSAPLAILVTDSALQITQMTTAAADLFGIRTPLQTPHVSQCDLPDGYPALAPICSEALQLGETTKHEFTSLGDQVMLTCTPYFDEHGKILGLTMVITVLPGLAAEAAELKMILSMSRIHLLNRDKDGTFLRVSDAAASILGMTRNTAIGQNAYDAMPEALAKHEREIDQALLSGKEIERESLLRIIPKDEGPTKVLVLERHRYENPQTGEPTVYNVGVDVSGVVDTVDQTLSVVGRIRQLSDLAGLGYWELDTLKQTVYWSDQAYKIHGFQKDEHRPKVEDTLAHYHPDDVDRVRAIVEDMSARTGAFHFRARLIRTDGEEITVDCNGISLGNYMGEVIKVIGNIAVASES